jgi:hypothetical protein
VLIALCCIADAAGLDRRYCLIPPFLYRGGS